MINKKSLEQLQQIENERVNDLVSRRDRFGADEQIVKYVQSNRGDVFRSTYTFPASENYPKNFNTKIQKKDYLKYHQTTCQITGKPALYKDPLT